MPEEMRWRRPGRAVGVVGHEIAVVVAARVRIGREKFGAAAAVSSVAATVWACGRRGRKGVVVAPYIADDRMVRRRGVAEFVGGAAMFSPSAAFW